MSRIETLVLVVFLIASITAGYKVLEQTAQVQPLVYKIVINK